MDEDGIVDPVTSRIEYDERLGVPLRWWVQGTMLVATMWLALVVSVPGPAAWLVTGLLLLFLAGGLLSYGSARISVGGGWLRSGRAAIEARHLGSTVTLDAEQTRQTAGVYADARAFLLLRPYLKRSVRVEIIDPEDPTPYWLMCTRHPERLATAIRELTESAHRVDPR